MNFRQKPVEELDVNLTPLIDVVFLLLIFFMVSTTFDKQSELSIDLPETKGEVVDSEKKVIDIAIDANGDFFIDKQKLTNQSLEELMKQMRLVMKQTKEPAVIISADKNTPHQSVMRVMDVARRLKLTHLTFAAVKTD